MSGVSERVQDVRATETLTESVPELRDVSDEVLAEEIVEFVRQNSGAGYLDIAEALRVDLVQAVRVADALAAGGILEDCE